MKNKSKFISFIFYYYLFKPICIILLSLFIYNLFKWHSIISFIPMTISINFSINSVLISGILSILEYFVKSYFKNNYSHVFTQLSNSRKGAYHIKNDGDIAHALITNTSNNVIFLLIKVRGSFIHYKHVRNRELYIQFPTVIPSYSSQGINCDRKGRLFLKLPESGIIIVKIYVPFVRGKDDGSVVVPLILRKSHYLSPNYLDKIDIRYRGND